MKSKMVHSISKTSMRFGIFIVLLMFVASCRWSNNMTTNNFIKIKPYQALPNPTHKALKDFVNDPINKNCAVVVRDLTANKGDLTSGENSRVCALLERGLLEQGYKPRDRKLFQTIVEKMGDNIDYKSIFSKTKVDLIFEITHFHRDRYNVDGYYSLNNEDIAIKSNSQLMRILSNIKNGRDSLTKNKFEYEQEISKKEHITQHQNFDFYGFTIEIRIVLVQDALIGGIYKYTYTPCSSENGGCLMTAWDQERRTLYYVPNDPFMTLDMDRTESSYVQSETDFTDNLLSQFFSNIVMPFMFAEIKEN